MWVGVCVAEPASVRRLGAGSPWELSRVGLIAAGAVDEIWFECPRWNGKYHIRSIQYMSPCPEDTEVHYAPALMYLREFQCLLLWALPPQWHVPWYHKGSVFFPQNSTCWTSNQSLICLPLLLSWSRAKQRVCHCSLWDFVQFERQRKSLFFFFFQRRCGFDNKPVSKWVVSLKVATKISINGITSSLLQSVIGPITAA